MPPKASKTSKVEKVVRVSITDIPATFDKDYPLSAKMFKYIREHGLKAQTTSIVMAPYIITPELCQEFLDYYRKYNHYNRPITPSGLLLFDGYIRDNKLLTTPQGLVFGMLQNLIDGQHRVTKMLEHGIALEMFVSIDVPDEVFAVIDNGKPRRVAVRMSTPEEQVGNITAAGISSIFINMRLVNAGSQSRDGERHREAYHIIKSMETRLSMHPSRYFGRAPVRAAALSYCGTEHEDYVVKLYNECAFRSTQRDTNWNIRDEIHRVLRDPCDVVYFTQKLSSLSDLHLFNRMCVAFHPSYRDKRVLPNKVPNDNPIVVECKTNLYKLFTSMFSEITLEHCLNSKETYAGLFVTKQSLANNVEAGRYHDGL